MLFLHAEGAFPEEMWTGFDSAFENVIQQPGFQDVWALRKRICTERMQNYVDNKTAKGTSKYDMPFLYK